MSERKPLGWVVVARDSEGDETASCRIFDTRDAAEEEIADMIADDEFPSDCMLRPEPIGSVPSGEREARERVRVLEEAVTVASTLVDQIGEIDLHEEAWNVYVARTNDESGDTSPTDADYVEAFLRAVRALASRPGTESEAP